MLPHEKLSDVGFEFTPEQVAELIVKEEEDKKPHYVFWAGWGDIRFDSTLERKTGMHRIRRGIITAVPMHYGYWDSDQGEKNSLNFVRNPIKGRGHEVWRIMRPGQIARDIERLYSQLGLKVLRTLTAATADFVDVEKRAAIVRNVAAKLITRVGTPKDQITFDEYREMVNEGIRNQGEDSLTYQVGMELLECYDYAESVFHDNLASKVGEMKDRNKPGGVGLGRLDEVAYEEIKILGKTPGDYEVDGDSWQHSMQQLLGKMGAAGGAQVNDALMTLLINQQQQQQRLSEQVNILIDKYIGGAPVALAAPTPIPGQPDEEIPEELLEKPKKEEGKEFSPPGPVWEGIDVPEVKPARRRT